MRKHTGFKLFLIAASVCAAVLLMVSVSGANLTSGDPLISLSYLTGSFRTQVLEELKDVVRDESAASAERFSERISAVRAASGGASDSTNTHTTVPLPAGSAYSVPSGAEFLFLSGDLSVLETGLTDTTLGFAPAAGEKLALNHLYVAGSAVVVQSSADSRILIHRS